MRKLKLKLYNFLYGYYLDKYVTYSDRRDQATLQGNGKKYQNKCKKSMKGLIKYNSLSLSIVTSL